MMETAFQSRFTKWLKSPLGRKTIQESWGGAVLWEAKVAKGSTLSWSAVQDHQMIALRDASSLSRVPMVHKISDSAIGYKPCDGFAMSGGSAILIVGFCGGREARYWFIEDVWALWYELRASGGRGGLKMDALGAKKLPGF